MPDRSGNALRTFAEAFFTRFGADIYPDEDEFLVALPPDLAEVFGKPRLYLVFPTSGSEAGQRRELSLSEDLLVYGSRTFDLMMSLLAERGEAAHFRLPAKYLAGSAGDFAGQVPLHNCRLVDFQAEVTEPWFYLFNFRIIYTADERLEEFMTIVLDAYGQPWPVETPLLLASRVTGDGYPLNKSEALAPHLDDLAERYEAAAVIVKHYADNRAAALEAGIRTRLKKSLLRLTTFYRRLMAEIESDDKQKDAAARAGLRADLKRKIGDELESYRLRVTISPLSYAIVLLPMAGYTLTLASDHAQQSLTLSQNLYTGHFDSPPCYHSRQPLVLSSIQDDAIDSATTTEGLEGSIKGLALCDYGHIVQPQYLDFCAHCQKSVCHRCGIKSCSISQELVCFACTAECSHCGHWLSADHVQPCAACGQAVCAACVRQCAMCGMSQCPGSQCGWGYKLDGECHTCHEARQGATVDRSTVPAITGLKRGRYKWQAAKNPNFTVYLGRSLLWGARVIVVDKMGQVLNWRAVSVWQWFVRRKY